MSRWKSLWRLMPLAALMTFLLTGCGDPTLSALRPKGPVAEEQLWMIKFSFGIMCFVLAVVFIIYAYVLIRFRKRKGQNDIPKQVEGNHLLEIVWTVIPIILLILIAVPTIQYTFKHSTDYRDDPNALHVKVTGHQFWWQFEYPNEGINTAQDLVIPVGKNIAFEIIASDVNHSFWVPVLGGKIDANVGITNVNYLKADEPGVYKGKCAELCGASHTLMDFKVVALPEAEYNAWVQKMKTPVTVSADLAAGEEVFKTSCIACHAIDAAGPGLGPNLNGFAERETIAGFLTRGDKNDENLKKWIDNPQGVKPGTLMPSMGLDDQQLDDVVKYLNSLK